MNKLNIIGWVMIILPVLIAIEEMIRVPEGNPIIWMWIVGFFIIVTGVYLVVTNKSE